jgi:hypothetical protein
VPAEQSAQLLESWAGRKLVTVFLGYKLEAVNGMRRSQLDQLVPMEEAGHTAHQMPAEHHTAAADREVRPMIKHVSTIFN